MLKRLPDGASILIRPIRADDKRMLKDGLRQLSDESVQRRFLTPKSSFSRSELRYLTEVDGRDQWLWWSGSSPTVRRLIAVGRCNASENPRRGCGIVGPRWHRAVSVRLSG